MVQPHNHCFAAFRDRWSPARRHRPHSSYWRLEVRQHKFKVGQKVRFFQRAIVVSPRTSDPDASRERYEITRLLPYNESEFQYRIKGVDKGQERVVTESEIG
jgi:hypothetical protein